MNPDERTEQILAAHEIVSHEFGPIHDVSTFQTWGPTVVVGATLANGCKVAIKASAMQDVRIEAHTSTLAAHVGFPVPAILGQGNDARLPGGHWFAMEHLRGVWWHNADWSRAQHLSMLAELAQHLVALHSVRIDGYGPLDLNGSGTFGSWQDWLRSGFGRSADTLTTSGQLPPGFTGDLFGVLEALSPELDRRPSVLLHSDLGDMEVYVDPASGTITGIVDWGNSIGGDPLYEFSRFVAGGPANDPRPALYRQPLREAYDRLAPSLSPHDPAIERLYDLHNTMLNAEWAVREAPDWVASLREIALAQLGTLQHR